MERPYFSADSFTILPIVSLGMKYAAVGTFTETFHKHIIMAVGYQDDTKVDANVEIFTILCYLVLNL